MSTSYWARYRSGRRRRRLARIGVTGLGRRSVDYVKRRGTAAPYVPTKRRLMECHPAQHAIAITGDFNSTCGLECPRERVDQLPQRRGLPPQFLRRLFREVMAYEVLSQASEDDTD